MRKIALALIITFALIPILSAQVERDIKSKITRVTVYTQGAQMENEASFELMPGKMQLSFKNLSPYINNESIRIDGDGSYTILNVQLKNDYLNQLEKSKTINDINNSIAQLQDKIEDEQTWIKILNEKIAFLTSNKVVTGKEQALNPETFKMLSSIYGDNFEKYCLEVLKRQRLIKDYTKELDKLNNQIVSLSSASDLPSGTITVVVDSKKTQTSKIRLSYLVNSASWYPSYDIRFVDTNKPLTIAFKANIIQNTGVDWKDIDLVLSTAKTNISAQIPDLTTNYLQFSEPVYAVGGVSVISNNAYPMQAQSAVRAEVASEPLNADGVQAISREDKLSVPLTITSKNETSNEYTVDSRQTVNSDNKLNTITFKEINLVSGYEYQSIPKLAKNVYLVGKVNDWVKADLMDGEANIYLENSFMGKSRINTRQYTDTLDISFGIDNNIMVNREKIKDYSESQFIGSNKKETYAWKITIRNNKKYPIKAKIWDQVPVSSVKDIQVETIELSGGIMNSNTGKVKWLVDLNAGETKQLILKYSVKYPKDKIVEVD